MRGCEWAPTCSESSPACNSSRGTRGAREARSALEQELGLVRVHQPADLIVQVRVAPQQRIVVHQRERHLARPAHEILVPPKRCQLEVTAALLPRAEDGSLPPQFQV